MKVHVLEREQLIPATLDRVFEFFSDAANLSRLTPPWLGFQILSPLPIRTKAETRIDYTIRLGPVPMRWRTRISVWEQGRRFVDEQERGPYALWEHTHEFTEMPGGVWMRDRVRYALPFGALGALAHFLIVRALLARIFDFRFARVRELFATAGGS